MNDELIEHYMSLPDGVVHTSNEDVKREDVPTTKDYEAKALYLIKNKYPVPTMDIDALAKMLQDHDETTDEKIHDDIQKVYVK